jgi:hypothetical protein
VFEGKVLRTTFGPKRVEMTGRWRKLHNEELHDLYTGRGVSIRRRGKGKTSKNNMKLKWNWLKEETGGEENGRNGRK